MREIWAQCELRNDRICEVTGMRFRSLDESIRDCVESLLAVASKTRAPGRVRVERLWFGTITTHLNLIHRQRMQSWQ